MTDLERILDKIAKKTAGEIERQIPFLEIIGMGGSLSEDNREVIFEEIAFNSKKRLTKDDGVILLSQIVSKYLKIVYAEKGMQAYLKKYPFSYKNIHIKVFISVEDGIEPLHPDINTISLIEGKVQYRTFILADNGYLKVKSIVKEPYEEALKRVSND